MQPRLPSPIHTDGCQLPLSPPKAFLATQGGGGGGEVWTLPCLTDLLGFILMNCLSRQLHFMAQGAGSCLIRTSEVKLHSSLKQ